MSGPLVLILLALGITLIGAIVVTARALDARAWARSLHVYRLTPPAHLKAEDVTSWLGSIAALTHAARGALLPSPPVVIEVRGTALGLEHRLLVPDSMTGSVLSSLRAALPGSRLEEEVEGRVPSLTGIGITVSAAVRLSGQSRQLATERAQAASRSLLAGMQPLQGDESITWQWIMTGAGTPPPVASKATSQDDSRLPWWLEGQAPADADEVRAARLKQREPLLLATGRLTIHAASRARAYALFGRTWGSIRLLNTPGARLVRSWRPVSLVRYQARERRLPLFGWPLRVNAAELAGLVALPLGESPLPGVAVSAARQLPPDPNSAATGTVLADSNYPGHELPLAISRRDRTMHVWLGGPTGVGKSTLLANMILQDLAAGDGLALIDPKGDLVTDVLARMPKNRQDDVIVLDPADTSRPVGLNVLGSAHDEAERDLAVDQVLHVLREQWAAFWGPRTDMVLRLSLSALVHSRAADGSAFTLCEVPEILTNRRFRGWVLSQGSIPETTRSGLRWFNGLSEGERGQVIGPAMNKLAGFTQRTPLRLMLGQSTGLDLSAAVRDRKILLMPLSRGRLGAETASVVGSLLVTGLWQTALQRVSIPADRRRPFWYYIDEAQEVVRLPVELADMLAEARGLGVGVVLANQHLSQLPDSVRRAITSTVRSLVAFQMEPDDARVMARSFAPHLDENDLRSLPAHEVAMRLSSGGQTGRPVTGLTRPLPSGSQDPDVLRATSRNRYGVDRGLVEAALTARLMGDVEKASGRVGARRIGSEDES